MNEEFKNGLTQSAKLKVCDELRECCVDLMFIREKFQDIVKQHNLPIGNMDNFAKVWFLQDEIEILRNKIEEE
tara:strand:- start:3 stop:221 length:219 start_codon:yes stop_codon:yes gene_type:complete